VLTWLRSLTQAAAHKTLPGVDVSSFRGASGGWSSVAGNIGWAAVKVTELEPDGTRYVNPDAATDWEWLRVRQKGRIAYLFGHPSVSAAATVNFFLGEIGRIGLLDTDAVALDLEVSDGLSSAVVASWAADVLSELQARVGRPPLLYTFLQFAQEGNCAYLAGYPLWIADPASPAGYPEIPAPWQTWAIHQCDVSGPIDRDVANYPSQAAMFKTLGKHAAQPPPPPPPPEEPTLINVGGNVTTIASARWPDGQMVVAGLGQDGYVQAARWDGIAWSDWGSVSPTKAIGTPSLIAWVDGLGLLFYIEESGAVVELTTTNRGKNWA
jgi:lysozyme